MLFPPDQAPGYKKFEIQRMGFTYGIKNTIFPWLFVFLTCGNGGTVPPATDSVPTPRTASQAGPVVPAANRTGAYMALLQGKKIGVVANQTSVIYKNLDSGAGLEIAPVHLVDSLLASGIEVVRVLAPEHGFRGEADAGEMVADGKDKATGLPVISLYGANRKPGPEALEDLDLVLFDIQDVGVRFYTYIATLQLVMEACAENHIPVIVLDRPNPNGSYVDGPTMEAVNRSFLGLSPIPLVYGMTIGEYAGMINGEGWLSGGLHADLTVIPLENYTHAGGYSLPIPPSPNLPCDQAIGLYPSLGLFEGTNVNAGRGTEYQFQRYGAPFLDSLAYDFSYVPEPKPGAKNPKQLGLRCYGRDLSESPLPGRVSLEWLLDAYHHTTDPSRFFNTGGFTKHAGTAELQQQIEAGWTEDAIRETWQDDLEQFRKIRSRYLLYP